MTLPIAIEIAVGLIFIYLTFSLLASELQELLSTLLQWRAIHLKESIEGFLSGNNVYRLQEARQIANQLYEHPAIQTLNHEAKGIAARLPRLLTRLIPTPTFGQRTTGPSYIAPDTFAMGLLETLGLKTIIQKVTGYRLTAYLQAELSTITFRQIEGQLRSNLRAYEEGRMTLDGVVSSVGEELRKSDPGRFQQYFASSAQKQYLMQQLSIYFTDVLEACYLYVSLSWRAKLCRRALRHVDRGMGPQGSQSRSVQLQTQRHSSAQPTSAQLASAQTPAQILQHIETWKDVPESLRRTLRVVAAAWMQKQHEVNIQAIAHLNPAELRRLGLTPHDLDAIPQAELFYKSFVVYEQAKAAMEGRRSLTEVEHLFFQLREHQELPSVFNNTLDKTLETLAVIVTRPDIRTLVERIPLSTLESLQIPARRLQLRLDDVGEGLYQFQLEMGDWFDRSMDRASGVYKRNARLVSFSIGLLIAMLINIDTIYMVKQLSQEQALRQSVAGLVERLPSDRLMQADGSANFETFTRLSEEVYPSLPIGWGQRNLKHQSRNDGMLSPFDAPTRITPLFLFKRIIGWLITGLAISMGAAFWYDLLGKVINVKNVGKKPPATSEALAERERHISRKH